MVLEFRCPATGHNLQTTFEIDGEDLTTMLAEGISSPCSFCGGLHRWTSIVGQMHDSAIVRRAGSFSANRA